MSQQYFITPASNDRWVWSTSSADTVVSRGEYRSQVEALDALRSYLTTKGMVVDQMTSNGMGFTVEASAKKDSAQHPMYFSASATDFIDDLKLRIDERVRDLAIARARSQGRDIVTEQDMLFVIRQHATELLTEETHAR